MPSAIHIVTGAAGFIGSNLVRGLNGRGITEIIAVDNLKNPDKFTNLLDCEISDYLDKREFIAAVEAGAFDALPIATVFHQGGCSDTLERDGRYVMENNYRYSVRLLDWTQRRGIRFVYASSAAVYGLSSRFEEGRNEQPLNIYGYSKLLFDRVVARRLSGHPKAQIAGLRYFNVYGPNEGHKGRMASVVLQFFQQYRECGRVRLFAGSGGYGRGEQRRDFVWIDDVVRANLFFLEHPEHSGIFNIGTGTARTYNDLARAVINGCRVHEGLPALPLEALQHCGAIDYIPLPAELEGRYQPFTAASMRRTDALGFPGCRTGLEHGIAAYLDRLVRADRRQVRQAG